MTLDSRFGLSVWSYAYNLINQMDSDTVWLKIAPYLYSYTRTDPSGGSPGASAILKHIRNLSLP